MQAVGVGSIIACMQPQLDRRCLLQNAANRLRAAMRARKLFGFSIIAITALSVMMSVDFMVPDSHNLLTYVW